MALVIRNGQEVEVALEDMTEEDRKYAALKLKLAALKQENAALKRKIAAVELKKAALDLQNAAIEQEKAILHQRIEAEIRRIWELDQGTSFPSA